MSIWTWLNVNNNNIKTEKKALSKNCTHIHWPKESIDQSNSTMYGYWNVFVRLVTLNITVSTKMFQVKILHATHTKIPDDHRHRHLLIHSLLITYAPLSTARFFHAILSTLFANNNMPIYWHLRVIFSGFDIIEQIQRTFFYFAYLYFWGVGFRSRKYFDRF